MRYVFGDYCLDTQRYELHNALMPLDEQARILDHLHAAEALAERLDDPQRLRSIAGRLCFYFVAMGEYNRALAAGRATPRSLPQPHRAWLPGACLPSPWRGRYAS
jgi:hypothetical protein